MSDMHALQISVLPVGMSMMMFPSIVFYLYMYLHPFWEMCDGQNGALIGAEGEVDHDSVPLGGNTPVA
jgi:hypothetical protein